MSPLLRFDLIYVVKLFSLLMYYIFLSFTTFTYCFQDEFYVEGVDTTEQHVIDTAEHHDNNRHGNSKGN